MLLLKLAAIVNALSLGQLNQADRGLNVALEDFLPAEIDAQYRSEACKLDTGGPCALWIAGDGEPRYMIFRRSIENANLWRGVQASAIVRAVAPESLSAASPRIRAIPRRTSSDPATFSVSSKALSGQVQLIVVSDDALVVWMPDGAPDANFEIVDVTMIDAPVPREIAEIRLANQPDVIDEDSTGFLWFSAWGNEVYRIDPQTDVPEAMTGATATGTPDGLMVDSSDNVWFGAYAGRYLGELSASAPLTRYGVPYPGGNPAIPCEAPSGNVWITDHVGNRVMEFDVKALAWNRAVSMPVTGAWVTQCKGDASGPGLWMTMYQAHGLGRLDLVTGVIEFYRVPCAPAFLALDPRGVWASCWDNGNIVQFDPSTLTGRLYRIPGASQAGGISIDAQGRIVFAQNALGRAAVLDADALEAFSYQLPSRPFFKDSILVTRKGTIWVPSPSNNLVGKVVP